MVLPLKIENAETIVRGMCTPFHVSSKGKIKPEAFEPTPDTDEVSVMRHCGIGSDGCKARALALQNLGQKKIYSGLAALTAGSVRSEGADVIDSRCHFYGHADIKLGFTITPGEPLPPKELLAMRTRSKALAKAARYYLDPAPNSLQWAGAPIT
ncbi:hypothetical protein [Burkholderia pseudomallei]|uniref:hypothetical protein n=1 Tax=Burkholderia pseudomallei TaxID=28450 RepID=UPI0011C46477|nr:hypothetical protein [Burkholderia pseudomallei]